MFRNDFNPDGKLGFMEQSENKIGEQNPSTGVINEYTITFSP
jgi:streptogramin lyase